MPAPSQPKTDYDQTGQFIAVDPGIESDSAGDSDYGSSKSEYSTDSLTSSIYEYRYENGRRYHAYKDGKYSFPNDEAEQERLDILHHIFLVLLDDKLCLAPIDDNPQRILDVGTGTGIWAIDAAERYPSAEVIGTDLSPIQPSWVPPNAQFQIDDAEGDWTFSKNSFDLVHIRHLNGSIKDWKTLIRQSYKALKPGGWINISEYEMNLWSDDGTLPKSSFITEFYDLLNKAAEMIGREFAVATRLKPFIEDAGFVEINQCQLKVPLGTWPAEKKQKDMGAYLALTIDTAFGAVGMAMLTRVLGMSSEEVDKVIAGAQKECRNKKIHTYSRQHIYYAQKPYDAHDDDDDDNDDDE